MIILPSQVLTVEQACEVKALEVLALSHEALQRTGPALGQHLHPLEVDLAQRHVIQFFGLFPSGGQVLFGHEKFHQLVQRLVGDDVLL